MGTISTFAYVLTFAQPVAPLLPQEPEDLGNGFGVRQPKPGRRGAVNVGTTSAGCTAPIALVRGRLWHSGIGISSFSICSVVDVRLVSRNPFDRWRSPADPATPPCLRVRTPLFDSAKAESVSEQSAPWTGTFAADNGNISDPFGSVGQTIPPVLPTNFGCVKSSAFPGLTYIQEWNLTAPRQVSSTIMVEAAYVGKISQKVDG